MIRKFITIALIILALFGCDESNNKISSVNNTIDFTIIAENEMPFPVLIKENRGFENFTNPENVIQHAGDTIRIEIGTYKYIEIFNKKELTDSLVIKAGDTLFLKNFDGQITMSWANKNEFLKNAVNYKDLTDKNFNNCLDTLINNYFKIDYKNPLELINAYSNIKVYPIVPNFKNLKDIKKMERFIKNYDSLSTVYKGLSQKKYNDTRATIYFGLWQQKMFNDLVTIYRLTKNVKLKKYLIDYSMNYLKSDVSTNEYVILRNLIFSIIYEDMSENSKSKTTYDIPYIYNDLANKIMDKTILEHAKIICLEEMIEQGNALSDITTFFDKFNAEYSNNSFKDYFEDTYLIDLKERYSSSKDLNLINQYGESITFNSLKNNLKGNVIYLDFWASWCAPCRKAMPASKQLLNEVYEKEKIIFLYFSIDKNLDAWQKASKIEGIESYKYNYLVLNDESSELMTTLKINEIPRYLIFDSEGHLVEDNAAGPTNENLIETLRKYILD